MKKHPLVHHVALCMIIGLTVVGTGWSKPELPAPRIHLLYTGQKGPTEPYTVTGFPACALPGLELMVRLADGSERETAQVKPDGSFEFTVPYQEGKDGFEVIARDEKGRRSSPMKPRLDYPAMGGMSCLPFDQRGWFFIAPATADEADRAEQWRRFCKQMRQAGFAPNVQLPNLSDSKKPEDLKVFGYTPAGDTAACIMGANRRWFSAPVRKDGTFTIRIPHEAVEPSWSRLATFIVNISDTNNTLLAASGGNPDMPEWAVVRQRQRGVEFLTGRTAPDFQLPRVGGSGSLGLADYQGRPVLLVVWGTSCPPCIRELDAVERMREEIQRAGVEVLAVSTDHSPEEVARFLRKRPLSFPVGIDTTGTFAEAYRVTSIPRSILVDRAGIIRSVRVDEQDEPHLRELLGIAVGR